MKQKILVWLELLDNFGSVDLSGNIWFQVSEILVGCPSGGSLLHGICRETPELLFVAQCNQSCLVSFQGNTAELWNAKLFLRTRTVEKKKWCRNIPIFQVNALPQLRGWKDIKMPAFIVSWKVLQHRVDLPIILPGHSIVLSTGTSGTDFCMAYDMSHLLCAGWRKKSLLEQNGLIVRMLHISLVSLWLGAFIWKGRICMVWWSQLTCR